MNEQYNYLGLRILIGGAVIDKDYFTKSFDEHLTFTSAACGVLESAGINCNLTNDQISAARDAHASGDMQDVFRLHYWPTYEELRSEDKIGDSSPRGYWTP